MYAYCRYTDDGKPATLLRAFVRQLVQDHGDLRPIVKAELEKRHNTETSLSESEALSLFQLLIRKFEKTSVVIDGLDEISNSPMLWLLHTLKKSPAQVLIISRPLQPYLRQFPMTKVLSLDTRNQEDIEKFVISSLEDYLGVRAMGKGTRHVVEEIASKIQQTSQGV